MTPNARRILISGGGPAGSVTAFWLAKGGFDVVVVERSTSRPYGQGIDVTNKAIDIIKKMGIYDQIRASTTGEEGMTLIDNDGNNVAPPLGTAPEQGGTASVTQEHEIMRSDLTRICAEAAKALPNVEYRYGSIVESLRQDEKGVFVTLSDDSEEHHFDAVIGADGLGSQIRKLAFDTETVKGCFAPTNTYVGFFSMPGDPSYDIPVGKLQHGIGGRGILIRPIDRKGIKTSCYIMATRPDPNLERISVPGTSASEQKKHLAELYKDFRGIGPRALKEMQASEDFYFTRVVQIRLPNWHSGRVALVGDAGYSPSPLTGQGTTLAIIGGYVLAGELVKSPHDPEAAFTRYREVLKDFVRDSQVIPLNGRAPKLALPQTAWGIWILRTIFRFISVTGLWRLVNLGNETLKVSIPDYDFDGLN